jgi:hypothetical protein
LTVLVRTVVSVVAVAVAPSGAIVVAVVVVRLMVYSTA